MAHQNSAPRHGLLRSKIGSFVTLFAVSLTVGTVLPAWAMWVRPTDMPVSRLLKSVGGYVRKHPKDAGGYYTLARIQSAAFALHAGKLRAYKESDQPGLPYILESQYESRDTKLQTKERDLKLLESSIVNYKRSTELDAKRGEAWFGLGFETEEAMRYPSAYPSICEVLGFSKSLNSSNYDAKELLRQSSLASYRLAFSLTVEEDMKPSIGQELVSKEAANSIIRLQQGRKLSNAEQAEQASMSARAKEIGSVRRYITPILIDFQRSDNLSQLVSSNSRVKFDLSGENPGQLWPWIKPTTGILVWDPHHTGKITSGLQLFGSVTWWLFWDDGYGPLAALDNNHNGWLEGKELDGIAVWFDRNGNGVSDPGEVVSLKSLGIKRIAVSAAGRSDGVPFIRHGVQFADGSFAATYDWTPRAVQ